MIVDTIIEDKRWEALGLEPLTARAASAVQAYLGLDPGASVVVMGCDDQRISILNADFRGKPQPTNVLSWPSVERASAIVGKAPDMPQGPQELGDIAIAFDTTEKEARAGGVSLEDHVTHLVVHGMLHLLGYDHEEDADGDLMESVETAILAGLGIADPYTQGTVEPIIDGKD